MSDVRWSVSVESVMATPVETVWDALTQPEVLCRWFCDTLDGGCQLNDTVAFHWTQEASGVAHTIDGVWTAVDPPGQLRLALSGESTGQVVYWTLESYRGGTRLVVSHEGTGPVPESALATQRGWEHGMANLRTVLDDDGVRMDARHYYRERGWS